MPRGQEQGETVALADEAVDSREWLYVDGLTAPFFRIGDELAPGETIGQTRAGERVQARCPSRVVGIEYDWESDQLILVLAPGGQHLFARAHSTRPGVVPVLAAG